MTLRQGLAFFLGFVALFCGVNAVWIALREGTLDLNGAMLIKALAIGAIATVVQYFILRKKPS